MWIFLLFQKLPSQFWKKKKSKYFKDYGRDIRSQNLKHIFSYGAFPLRHDTFSRAHFWGVSTGYSTWYLVIFLVPPRLRFQASRTITKTWRVISADHWLDEENRHCLCHWTCVTRRNRPARLKSAQPAKDQMQLFWMSALCFVVCWVSTDVPSLIAEERIQRERDGATQT